VVPGGLYIAQTTSPSSATIHIYNNLTANSPQYLSPLQMQQSVGTTQFSQGQLYVDVPIPWDDLLVPETDANIKLPDGTVIEVKKDGSFKINDSNAKVIYKANRVLEFNKYLNASDMVEGFIRYCGIQRVRQGQVLELPIKLFIGWLLLEAAEADKAEAPVELLALPTQIKSVVRGHCVSCGRFLRVEWMRRKLQHCGPPCFDKHYQKALCAT
jgi:hypothetical protein